MMVDSIVNRVYGIHTFCFFSLLAVDVFVGDVLIYETCNCSCPTIQRARFEVMSIVRNGQK